jgi:hypothetical protein
MYLRKFIKLYLSFMYNGGYNLSRELKDGQGNITGGNNYLFSICSKLFSGM